MQRTVTESVYGLYGYAIANQSYHDCIVKYFAHGWELNCFSLGVDPSEDCVKDQYEYGRSNAHDKPEVGVLRVVISGLRDGGVSSSALFVFDDAHVVGVEGCEYDDGQVDDDYPI